ncbi:MAG: hypothetical protein NPIRA02_38690 [Nitrospirales bacterium]|nr:MAG: hypothetical protein NPIRA02_38690 [Nitrospirales bacterium]
MSSVLKLPFYGHVCASVHKGYKIFDINKGKVTKMFDTAVAIPSVSEEIERLKKVSKLDFAPSLSRWNIAERWYEEDYVYGLLDSSMQTLGSDVISRKFCEEYAQQMCSMMLCQPMMTRKTEQYIDGLVKTLEDSKGSGRKIRAADLIRVKVFIDSLVERLKDVNYKEVQLVFSHGDFIPNNILHTKNGMRVIDWEDAAHRSALFDFYSYFFYRPTIRNVPVSLVVSEVDYALPSFMRILSEKKPEISSSILQARAAYRWIFYLELICRFVVRDITEERLEMRDFLFQYLTAFTEYEKITSSG